MSTKIKAGETVGTAMKFGSKRKSRAVRMKVACEGAGTQTRSDHNMVWCHLLQRLLKERARAAKRKKIASALANTKPDGVIKVIEKEGKVMEGSTASKLERRKRKRHPMAQKSRKKRKISHKLSSSYDTDPIATPTEEDDDDILEQEMKGWVELGVPHPLIWALHDLKFYRPTEIQRRAIPLVAEGDNDIIGAAETGSGKTLAFGIPILQYILNNCSTKHNTTEHAQKHSGIVKPEEGTATCSKMSEGDKPQKGRRRHKNESEREENVIDLNEVLHQMETSEMAETDETAEISAIIDPEDSEHETETSKEERVDQPFLDEMETPDQSLSLSSDSELEGELDVPQDLTAANLEGSSKRSKGKAKMDTGLVGFKDDIPEEEFQKMLTGELDPWESGDEGVKSRDDGDTKERGSEVNKSVRLESHDIKAESYDSGCGNGLIALILAPTRELAIQVHDHLTAVARKTDIKVCAVVGGMAMEKQERLLSRHPSIVVATPGRLWSLMSEGNAHLNSLESLKFLVLDEADRMVEFGHFRELRNILDRLNGVQSPAESSSRQTMVFSATLTVGRRTTERRRKKKNTSSQESLDNLMEYVKLKENAHLVDLTRSKVTVETLTETKITCTTEEKDMYLYYFLLLYPGRTLVFVNSIDCLQRLRALLELLHMKPLPLHAHMQQRQRLKNLDRFTSSESGVLVASDVAARGLDLPQVQHVIHYQVPRNTELYVHRSGRTARAQREGLSVMLVGPEDVKAYRNICRSLNKDEELPSFPVDSAYLKAVRRRVSLARQLHSLEHKRNKTVRAEQWISKSAKAMDIEIDEDLLEEHSRKSSRREKRGQASGGDDAKIKTLRAELQQLLRTAILPRTISMTFPTRDHTHQSILANIQGARKSGMNEIVVSKKKDALTVARTKSTS